MPKDRNSVLNANIARAEKFAEGFPELDLKATGVARDSSAFVAHYDKETLWGFTAKFVTTGDGQSHIHAFVEFVGPAKRMGEVVKKFQKFMAAE